MCNPQVPVGCFMLIHRHSHYVLLDAPAAVVSLSIILHTQASAGPCVFSLRSGLLLSKPLPLLQLHYFSVLLSCLARQCNRWKVEACE